MADNVYDLIIIGGGPAGASAGIYGARKALKTLLLSKNFTGQIGKTGIVENYPGILSIAGQELMNNFKKHLEQFQVSIKEGEGVEEIIKQDNVFIVKTSNNSYQTKAVIIASGRSPRLLQIPGEKEFIGKGVSYCSICDAPLFRDKVVAVIGGGNAGFETAIDLLNYAKKVHLLESAAKPVADEILQTKLISSGKTEIITQAKITEIKGNGLVASIIYEDAIGQQKELAVQGVFVQIGSLPSTGFLKNLVDFNKAGEIIIDPKTGETKTPGLFAAGDATDVKYKQLIIAAGEGAKAALSAHEYLQQLELK